MLQSALVTKRSEKTREKKRYGKKKKKGGKVSETSESAVNGECFRSRTGHSSKRGDVTKGNKKI